MKLDLLGFILKNFRERVHWSVYQNNELLGKGSAHKDEVYDIIKGTDYKVWTEDELFAIAKEKEKIRLAKKKASKEKKKAEKSIIVEHEFKNESCVKCGVNEVHANIPCKPEKELINTKML